MAIILVEGFDALTATQTIAAYPNSNTFSPAMQTGRFGGQAFQPSFTNQNGNFSVAVSSLQSLAFGAALLLTAANISGAGTGIAICRIDGSAGRQFSIGVDSTGAIKVGTGTALTLASSPAGVITADAFHYWEVAIFIHDTAGTIRVDVDGVTRINLTNVDTKGQTATVATGVTMSPAGSGNGGLQVDDFYLKDDLTLLGPQRVETLRPDGDSSVAWTPNSGSNNFSRVNENVSDGDTTYVSASTAATLDRYTLGNLSDTPSSIAAVVPVMVARMDDAGPRTVRVGVRSGSSDGWGSAVAMTSSYVPRQTVLETDPATSGAWSASAVNGMLGQIEVVS